MARKRAAEVTSATELRDRVNATMKGKLVTLGDDPHYTIEKIPTGSLVIDRLLLGGFARGRHSVLQGDYQCVSEESLVLMGDLGWRHAGSIETGDVLAAFDEEAPVGRGRQRQLVKAVVRDNTPIQAECFEIETDLGSVTVASDNHRWLCKASDRTLEWRMTDRLREGDEIRWFSWPWSDDAACGEVGKAYLEAAFDGEGSFDSKTLRGTGRFTFYQRPGYMLEKVRGLLDAAGFIVNETLANGQGKYSNHPCYQLAIGGGVVEQMRFARQIAPGRLLLNAGEWWLGKCPSGKGAVSVGRLRLPATAIVVSIKPVGKRWVFPVTNDAHTFIADGLMGHNSAKSLTLYRTMALAQERGETCALIDAENVFNERWFRQLGGDPSQLVLYPDREGDNSKRDANELGNVMRTMIQKGEGIVPADVVGIDSVASLLPSEELEHDLEDGDPRVASLARLMPLLLRMLTTMNDKTAFIWTNQMRDKISRIPGQKSFPGGRSLGFFASTIIEMIDDVKETEERTLAFRGKEVTRKVTAGRWINCTTTKEKTGARPGTTRSFLLDFDTKMPSREREIVDLGIEDGLIDFRGGRYYVKLDDGERGFHGIKKLVTELATDDELSGWLVALIEEKTYDLAQEYPEEAVDA